MVDTGNKYPTSNVSNAGSWTNPNNSLNVEDAVCATKITTVVGEFIMVHNGFGFALPADAIIDNIFINCKSAVQGSHASFQTVLAYFVFGGTAVSSLETPGGAKGSGMACSNALFAGEKDVYPFLLTKPTVSDLNSETFEFRIVASVGYAEVGVCRCDAAYLRVVYHVPEVGGVLAQVI